MSEPKLVDLVAHYNWDLEQIAEHYGKSVKEIRQWLVNDDLRVQYEQFLAKKFEQDMRERTKGNLVAVIGLMAQRKLVLATLKDQSFHLHNTEMLLGIGKNSILRWISRLHLQQELALFRSSGIEYRGRKKIVALPEQAP